MTATKIQPRKPIAYSGNGSAIDFYRTQQTNPTPSAPQKKLANWGLFDKSNQAHKQIVSLLYQAQWVKQYEGRTIPDILRFSNFLHSEKSPVNKPLKKMDKEEVSKIIVALEGIVMSTHK